MWKQAWVSMVLILGLIAPAWGGSGPKLRYPRPAQVKQAVERFFASQEDYEPGGLILRHQVQELFKQFRRKGWKVPRPQTIINRVVSQEDYLAQKLYTSRGRRFMRKISQYEQAYDVLDRLIRIPDGKKILARIINEPGGHRLIGYMTSASGGRELRRMLTRVPGGKNFHEPTGRIYTAKQLIEEINRRIRYARQKRSANSSER